MLLSKNRVFYPPFHLLVETSGLWFVSKEKKHTNHNLLQRVQGRSQMRNPRWISEFSEEPWHILEQTESRGDWEPRMVGNRRKFVGFLAWTWRKYKEIWPLTLHLPTFELWSCFTDCITYMKDKIFVGDYPWPYFQQETFARCSIRLWIHRDESKTSCVLKIFPVPWKKQLITEWRQWEVGKSQG